VNRRRFLAWSIVSTLLQLGLIAVIGFGLLPLVGVHPAAWLVIVFIGLWVLVSALAFRVGWRAIRRHPVTGLDSMVGERGVAVSRLAPSGSVRVAGELWAALADSGVIEAGEEVVVTGQEKLVLTVHSAAQVVGHQP
jgi:membrane-bound ClpP family serine protease